MVMALDLVLYRLITTPMHIASCTHIGHELQRFIKLNHQDNIFGVFKVLK